MTDPKSQGSEPSQPPRRPPGHRAPDVRDTVAEMAAKAKEISEEAGSRMGAAMKELITAAAGLAGFAVESARDLVQFMVRRGQMTQEEADKLMKEVESAQPKRKPAPLPPKTSPASVPAAKTAPPPATHKAPAPTSVAKAPAPAQSKTTPAKAAAPASRPLPKTAEKKVAAKSPPAKAAAKKGAAKKAAPPKAPKKSPATRKK